MRRMQHVGDALQSLLQAAGLAKGVARWRVVVEWPRVVGKEVADHCEALRLQRGILWVAVPSSSWMQHLTFLKPKILDALRREFPDVQVRDIHCVMRTGRGDRRDTRDRGEYDRR
jgi:predicted nucleic acid-binding Zn ribbon protein